MTSRISDILEALASTEDGVRPLYDVFAEIFTGLDARITSAEAVATSLSEVRQQLTDAGMVVIATALDPVIAALATKADLGAILTASSVTEATVGGGLKTFVISPEAARAAFAPANVLSVVADGFPTVSMYVRRVSYDATTGELVVDVIGSNGSGTYASWVISPSAVPDFVDDVATAVEARDLSLGAKADAEAARDTARDHRDAALVARTAAISARDQALAAQAGAEAVLDGLDNAARLYCGASSTEPTTLPDGGARVVGAEWFDTAAGVRKQWTGSSWDAIYVPSTSAVSSFAGRVGAVSPAAGDYTADKIVVAPAISGGDDVQEVLGAHATAIGTKADASALAGKADASHGHAIGDVAGLTTALAGKSNTGHGHAIDEVSGLTTALAGKSDTGHTHGTATTSANGFMSAADKTKLDGVASNANNYSHPTGDGNLHVPATGTGNSGKALKAGATAGSAVWGSVLWGELGSIPVAISSVGGLTPAANKLPYFTSDTGAALATFTDIGRSVVGAADAAAVRTAISAADASHTHTIGNVTGLQAALDEKLSTADASNSYVAKNSWPALNGLDIDRAAGNTRTLYFKSGGSARWAIYASAAAESGSNAGSDFAINRLSDAGATIGTSLSISRATGAWSIGGSVSVSGSILSTSYVQGIDVYIDDAAGTARSLLWKTSGSVRWNLYTDGAAEAGLGEGSDLRLVRYSDAGTTIGTVFAVFRADGTFAHYTKVQMTGDLSVNGTSLLGAVDTTSLTVNTVKVLTADNGSLAVGSFALMQVNAAAGVSNGATIAGGQLNRGYLTAAGAWSSAAAPSGTWRNMQGNNIAQNGIGLFQRIA